MIGAAPGGRRQRLRGPGLLPGRPGYGRRPSPADEPDVQMTLPWLFATMIASSVGFGVFTYGRKQLRVPQLVVGLVLMILPGFLGTGWVWATLALAMGALWIGTRAGL